ncbi:MAG: thiol-disulfide isomerase, partial [Bryobacterales bacterium]|nr:thiol-disulfide isomerase [Bryobacterales bacterium]
LCAGETVTFHRDVEPVLQAHCQQCHRPGEAAPMSFLTYEETRPWARAIHEAVALNRMPPWPADPQFGQWSNAHALAAGDRRLLIEWAETGAGRGDPGDAPAPLEFVEGWNIGQPDLVLEMPVPFQVPAEGTIDYQYLVLPTGFKEDKWVSAAEVRPGNRAVVHHVLAYIRPRGSHWLEDAEPGKVFLPSAATAEQRQRQRGEFRDILVGFAPGTEAVSYEGTDRARLLPAGADIVLQLHYTASGREESDRSRIGLRFQDAPPAKRLVTLMAAN